MNNTKVEVADIFRKHIGDYLEIYKMPQEHYEVVSDIIGCRTEWLGGHLQRCDCCGAEIPMYNSCRNRHCPKCQSMVKERWLEKRKSEVLPVKYFHNVFTLPHEINPIVLCNKKVMINILFRSVSETLIQFGYNPENGLGGKLGFMAFLHTWDQKILGHYHVHCIIPAGALGKNGEKWIECKYDYIFPERALSKVFRGKFMDYFKQAYKKGELIFPGNTEKFGTSSGFYQLKNILWSKNWVVDVEPPLENPDYVIEYLGRYTHRVAISNHRILDLSDGKVTFSYKNRKKGTIEPLRIDAVEFIRRFLLHVLPKGLMRIRYYGFLANRCKRDNLAKCREFLGAPRYEQVSENKTVREIMLDKTGRDITKCPFCKKGTMFVVSGIGLHTGVAPYDIIHAKRDYKRIQRE
ncbi:MAG: IS91 family transposase [Deltaproteobacteria bacterium]|nr:IS91 family transposase [Deltaproteobacteria bacterium]